MAVKHERLRVRVGRVESEARLASTRAPKIAPLDPERVKDYQALLRYVPLR